MDGVFFDLARRRKLRRGKRFGDRYARGKKIFWPY
jgi:hypothetical protein